MPTVELDSRETAFVACARHIDALEPCPEFSVTVPCARDPDARIIVHAAGSGIVDFRGNGIRYHVKDLGVVGTGDVKPQPARKLCLTAAKRETILEFVEDALAAFRTEFVDDGVGMPVYTWMHYWEKAASKKPRDMSTIFLPGSVAEDCLADLRAFLDDDLRQRCARLHVAPVRTYLFKGVWGSGKTSLVHCLATATGYGISSLSFGPQMANQDLMGAVRQLPRRTFLVIEDIDAMFDNRSSKTGVDFGSVLATLDGACNQEPLIVFLTTNHADRLDPALRRRVDYVVEYGHATKDQCRRMFAAFFPHGDFESVWDRVRYHTFPTSVFQKYLVRSMYAGDPLARIDQFPELVDAASSGKRAEMYT